MLIPWTASRFSPHNSQEYSPLQLRDFRSSQRCFWGFSSFWEWFLTFKRSVLLPPLRVKGYLTLEPGGSTFLRNTEESLSQRHSITSPKTWILRLKMYFCILSCFLYHTENTVSIKKTNGLRKKVFKQNVRCFRPILTKWRADLSQSHHIRISQQSF